MPRPGCPRRLVGVSSIPACELEDGESGTIVLVCQAIEDSSTCACGSCASDKTVADA